MKVTALPSLFVACTALFLSTTAAEAQLIKPTPRPSRGAVPQGLVCTAEAANVSAFVDSAGGISIYNVPSNLGQVVVRATCIDPFGATVSGQAVPVVPVAGGVTRFSTLDFGNYVPIAAHLALTPSDVHLVGLGSSIQLAVDATFADQSNGDVTAGANGTTYTTSNPNIATVSADGLITAVGPGTAIIYALNEGAGGLATVSVLPAALASLSVVPGSLNFALSPVFPAQPAQLQVTAHLTNDTSVDWTPSGTGVTYQSSDPSVAVVGIDGNVLGISPGFATITIIDGPSGISTQISTVVTTSTPEPANACATPGYAYNVDIDGIWAFVASGSSGLQIVNTNDCSTGGSLPLTGKNTVDVKVRGTLAAVALESNGFALVDVSNIATPHLHSTTTSIGSVHDVWLSGNTLYVASSNGLFVYDVTTPTAPVLLGSQAFNAPAKAVAGDSTRGVITVLTAAPALEVVQMNGTAPWASVNIPLSAGANPADDVTLFGTSAYVANGTYGIHRIDVTNAAAPFIAASSTLTFDAVGVAVQQTPLGVFVAAADDMFVNAVPLFGANLNNTFNIDFSSFPGTVQSDANSNGIALGDGFGVVTTGPTGIQIFRSKPIVDNAGVPPTVSLLSPAQGADVYAGLFVSVNATATDDVAVTSVNLFLDGQFYASTNTRPFHFVFPAGSAGTAHDIQLQATDPGGNIGVSLPVTVNSITPPPQVTGFTVLGGSPVNYGGIDYTVLQVAFNSADSVGATWCDDYRSLCQVYGLAPTGCGNPYANQSDGYGACSSQYGSAGESGNLGCDPSNGVVQAAHEAGFSDAGQDNSFGFNYCDSGTCQKTMCTGSFCQGALTYIDLTKPFGYTVCAAPPTCDDGHKNQGEAGVDCGGPCAQDCCGNNTKDAQETGLDCGGPLCAACTDMCNDGVRNSDELGVDCGGSFCGPCPNVIFIDTLADDVPSDVIFNYFSSLSASESDFIYAKIDTNGDPSGVLGSEWCFENAAFYVSSYVNFAPTGNVVSSGNWNKYTRPQGSDWSAPDTNSYTNYYGSSCDGTPFSWCSDWGVGNQYLAFLPNQTVQAISGLNESYVNGWTTGASWIVEIKVGATRAVACGF